MLPLARKWADGQIAVGDHPSLIELLQDHYLGRVPKEVPAPVVKQVVLAVGCDQLQELTGRGRVQRHAGKRLVCQLGYRRRGATDHRQRALDFQASLDRTSLPVLGSIQLQPVE